MTDALLIVFVKNITLGAVKTRLAKTIGNAAALEVYSELVKITEKATADLQVDQCIYFSNNIENLFWKNCPKAVQRGADLGERMRNAFEDGFAAGYKKIVLIGSDLPCLNSNHIKQGIEALKKYDAVFGPAEDGGYYLVGMTRLVPGIFENKPWSQPNLLHITLKELRKINVSVCTIETLNDIDTYEDLIASEFYRTNQNLQQKIKQLND